MPPHDPEVKPRFSSFAVMIAILLLIFGVMSKFDRIVPLSLELLASSETTAKATDHGRESGRIVEVIGNSETLQSNSKTILLPEQKKIESTPVAPAESPALRPALPEPEINTNSEEAERKTEPICPRKPRRGDKLVESPKIVLTNGIPAEGRQNSVHSLPVRPKEYIKAKAETRPVTEIPVQENNGRHYTISSKDTLWSIAKRFYGNGRHYTVIESANPGFNHETMRPGQRIFIPGTPPMVASLPEE